MALGESDYRNTIPSRFLTRNSRRWYLTQPVGYPGQYVNMLPSRSRRSLVVDSGACSTSSAKCPDPIPILWSPGGSFTSENLSQYMSSELPGDQWDSWNAALLRMEGSGQYMEEPMTLHMYGEYNKPWFLRNHTMMLSNNYTVNFPGGAFYTVNSGFVRRSSAELLWFLEFLTSSSFLCLADRIHQPGHQAVEIQRPPTILCLMRISAEGFLVLATACMLAQLYRMSACSPIPRLVTRE